MLTGYPVQSAGLFYVSNAGDLPVPATLGRGSELPGRVPFYGCHDTGGPAPRVTYGRNPVRAVAGIPRRFAIIDARGGVRRRLYIRQGLLTQLRSSALHAFVRFDGRTGPRPRGCGGRARRLEGTLTSARATGRVNFAVRRADPGVALIGRRSAHVDFTERSILTGPRREVLARPGRRFALRARNCADRRLEVRFLTPR